MTSGQRKAPANVGAALVRALRSTVIISAIAIAIFALRRGTLRWVDLEFIAIRYWPLGVAVFFFVLFWDLWFRRTKRPRLVDEGDR